MADTSAILLAAGESKRMGTMKALLPWQGVTLIEYQIDSLLSAGVDEICLVVGHRYKEISAPIKSRSGIKLVVNENYMEGKTTSIKAGLNQINPNTDTVMILSVDQPRPRDIISTILNAHKSVNKLITYPTYKNKGGHPVIFDGKLLPELNNINETNQGLREITRRYANMTQLVKFDNIIVTIDLNSPESFRNAIGLFA
jgi:molybdenum cofactor cytidylyltransferase